MSRGNKYDMEFNGGPEVVVVDQPGHRQPGSAFEKKNPNDYTPSEIDERERELGSGCFGMKGGCFQSCNPVEYDRKNCIEYYQDVEDRSCWFRIPPIYIRFNPVVTIGAICIIWGFVAWCMIQPEAAGGHFATAKGWVTDSFTWLYIVSQDIWAVLIVMIYCSKYGNIKLGKDDEKPEYSDATWFTMLFACGIGVGLFFFGVAEPVWHYDQAGGGNRYISDKYMADNSLAQIAMNVTFYHWGIHGWIVYCIVGMLMGLVSYRMGLPMTVKSCFYPLLGDKIFGWMGDFIDTLSIMTTLFGVCTSLGLGTMQLNTGINILNPDIPVTTINQIIIIWCVTAVATLSTLSGVGLGIRRLSELCFGVGMIIMMVVLFLDNTWFILNLYVQSIGYYFQWLLQLGFHTDAFEQLGPADGGQDGRNRIFPDGSSDGPENWMDGWTMFYWGWWISWSPFVGMFVAKISRGRTLRNFINGTMTAPIIYTFFWLTIFGGSGLKMEREAAGIGLCCGANFNDTFNSSQNLPPNMGNWACRGDQCNECANSIIGLESKLYGINNSDAFFDKLHEQQSFGTFGTKLDDNRLTRLSCRTKEQMWFDLMSSYGDLADTLSVFSLIGIVLYFVTSSDSGSFVIDCLSANGDKEPPRIQRVFWALTEGATATALLWAGGKNGLEALQTVSVVSGLPYTIILCFMCVSLWRALAVDAGDLDNHGPQFAVGLFDVFAVPTLKGVGRTIANIVIAPYTFAKVMAKTDESDKKTCLTIFYTIFLFILLGLFVVLYVCTIWVGEIWAIGWVCYLAFAFAGGSARISVRQKYGINGNMIEDICCGIFTYPLLAYQLDETIELYEDPVELRKANWNPPRPENLDPTSNSKQNGHHGAYNAHYGMDKGDVPLDKMGDPVKRELYANENMGYEPEVERF